MSFILIFCVIFVVLLPPYITIACLSQNVTQKAAIGKAVCKFNKISTSVRTHSQLFVQKDCFSPSRSPLAGGSGAVSAIPKHPYNSLRSNQLFAGETALAAKYASIERG
ncbi:MAG: hypothetical protein IJJ90_03305 [Prevotella sp.]|nr:hypothetical protein [Prevotella sp.]